MAIDVSNQYGQFMDFCRKYNRMPTETAYEIYSMARSFKVNDEKFKSEQDILDEMNRPIDLSGMDIGVIDFSL